MTTFENISISTHHRKMGFPGGGHTTARDSNLNVGELDVIFIYRMNQETSWGLFNNKKTE
jgi:hypothetical protein